MSPLTFNPRPERRPGIDPVGLPNPGNREAYARHLATHKYLTDVPQLTSDQVSAIGVLVSRLIGGNPMREVERDAERLLPGLDCELRDGLLHDGIIWCLSQADLANFRASDVVKFVTIDSPIPCCPACSKTHNKRFTLDEATELPLADCTAEPGCRCVYRPVAG